MELCTVGLRRDKCAGGSFSIICLSIFRLYFSQYFVSSVCCFPSGITMYGCATAGPPCVYTRPCRPALSLFISPMSKLLIKQLCVTSLGTRIRLAVCLLTVISNGRAEYLLFSLCLSLAASVTPTFSAVDLSP